jgi:xanthine dehydrogenase YagR molybdenum-binding subunit
MSDVIGKPLDRVDGPAKVQGNATYAAEFAVPGMVHAVLVQSTIAAGRIAGFDLAEAQAMPGVLLIMTPDNAPRLADPGAGPVKGPLLQDRSVLFNGAHVAVVVAAGAEQAEAAAARVRVRYQRDEAATVMDAVLSQAHPPREFRNGQRPPDSGRGDADAVFGQGAVRIDATYVTPMEHHNPMEPHATIAQWQGERLTVWTATQGIAATQSTLAGQFGLAKKNVRVLCPFVGGGFGCKGNTWPPATLAAMAAKQVGRPVRLVVTRAQMFTSNGYRPRTLQRLRIAADADGRLLSLRHDGISQMSQPQLGEYSEPVGLASEMLYACDNVAISHRVVPTHASLPTYMRAPGEASGMFALESAMDEAAAALKLDPVEFRLRNYAATDPSQHKPFASKRLRDCYTEGAAAFGWQHRSAAPRSMRDGNTLIGWGFATATYPTNQMPAHVRVRLRADGSVLVQCATQDLGTGTYTVMTQVAAETLGVPVRQVTFQLGDSDFPPAGVSGGSSTVPSVSPTVAAACGAVRERLFALAQRHSHIGAQGGNRDALRIEHDAVVGPGGRVPLAQLLADEPGGAIEATADGGHNDAKKTYSLHAFGAQFAEVRVDADLGEIRVSRLVGAFDCGRVLNAKTARSQLIGGMVYGVGMALLEETHTDAETGRIVNANLADYLVPVNADIPDIQTIIVPNDERTSNPLGVKGIGELPMVGVAAAIANAVYHATGVRVRKLPIRLEDVLA